MFFKEAIYLIGAETDNLNAKQSLYATEELAELLCGLKVKSLVINLNKKEEIVYAVSGEENVNFIASLAKRFNQTHYIVIHTDGECYAVGKSGNPRYLGILKKIKKPADGNYWLYDVAGKQYYKLKNSR